MMIKSIIPRCIQTIIIEDQAQGILIIPVWPTQPWFSQAHTTPTTQQVTTNGLSTLWESFKGTLFLQKLPRSSWPLGKTAQRNNIKSMLRSGWHFVIKGAFLTVH